MKPVVSCFVFIAFTAALASSLKASAIPTGTSVLDAVGKGIPGAKKGRRQADDPLTLLTEEVAAEVMTLALRKPRTPAEEGLMDDLKDFLAMMSGMAARPHTRKESDSMAAALKQFLLHRDIKGALAWMRAH